MFKDITKVKHKVQPVQMPGMPVIPGNSYAYPINSSRAQRKCRKLAKKNNCTYMEAGEARLRRVGF